MSLIDHLQPGCTERFGKARKLRAHLNSKMHLPFACGISRCPFAFKTEAERALHRDIHGGCSVSAPPPVHPALARATANKICDVGGCGARFVTFAELLKHRAVCGRALGVQGADAQRWGTDCPPGSFPLRALRRVLPHRCATATTPASTRPEQAQDPLHLCRLHTNILSGGRRAAPEAQ